MKSKAAKLTRTLGGNIAASIGGGTAEPIQADPADERLRIRGRDNAAVRIPLDRIGLDLRQPRQTFDPLELQRLADSLKAFGQLQPCVVHWDHDGDGGNGIYRLVAGERRYRAATLAGMTELRCTVIEKDLAAGDRRELQIIENALRCDVPPVEQAEAFQELMAYRKITGKELAAKLHIDPATVTRSLALLKVAEPVRDAVQGGRISASTAYEISKAPAEKQTRLAQDAVSKKLNRDEVAAQVKAAKRPAEPVICTSITPWTWTAPKGESIRISPRPGAQIFGIISIANLLKAALAAAEAEIESEMKSERGRKRVG